MKTAIERNWVRNIKTTRYRRVQILKSFWTCKIETFIFHFVHYDMNKRFSLTKYPCYLILVSIWTCATSRPNRSASWTFHRQFSKALSKQMKFSVLNCWHFLQIQTSNLVHSSQGSSYFVDVECGFLVSRDSAARWQYNFPLLKLFFKISTNIYLMSLVIIIVTKVIYKWNQSSNNYWNEQWNWQQVKWPAPARQRCSWKKISLMSFFWLAFHSRKIV